MEDDALDKSSVRGEKSNLVKLHKNKRISESLFGEQLISECEKAISGKDMSHLTLDQYNAMSKEQRSRLNNRVRQWAQKVKDSMPRDHGIYCLVLDHLLRNAHREFRMPNPSQLQQYILGNREISEEVKHQVIEEFKVLNQKVRLAGDLRKKKRTKEQQDVVSELRSDYGSYRNISAMCGISVKTIHKYCSETKEKIHKATELCRLRKEEYEAFLMQDTITFEHPCKKFAGKRFLRDTLEVTRNKYLQQPQYHKFDIISRTSMIEYHPSHIYLCGDTPIDTCLCPKCRNCEQLMEKLRQIGVKGLPADKYKLVSSVQCCERYQQSQCDYEYPRFECIVGECENCGLSMLEDLIRSTNEKMLKENKNLTWRRWMNKPGKSTPDNLPVKGTLKQAVDSLLTMIPGLSKHLFRSTWNRSVYDYVKKHLVVGRVAMIFDFSMNFRNFHQMEVQSAFYNGTQTGIHSVINHLLCPTEGCTKILTIILAQITADLDHDSFVARAAHDAAFKYLAESNIPLDLVLQFCDNCGSQYKSRCPFAELAHSSVNIIRTYFGESHGKGECDGFFGRLKNWMTKQVKTQKVILNSAYDFFIHCRDNYCKRTTAKEDACEHYKVVFQYLTPSDIKRHQNCNLEKAVQGTQSFFSIRNTSEPLKLKV